jgi:hypothetical protein
MSFEDFRKNIYARGRERCSTALKSLKHYFGRFQRLTCMQVVDDVGFRDSDGFGICFGHWGPGVRVHVSVSKWVW